MPESQASQRLEWAEYVDRVLKERGESTRGQRRLTGLARSTVQGWMDGIKPQMHNVVAFAQGFGLNVNETLAIAGLDPLPPKVVEPGVGPEPLQQLEEGMEALADRFNTPELKLSLKRGQLGQGTEDVERWLGAMERVLEQLQQKGEI